MSLFRRRHKERTEETVSLMRAVKHVAEALTCDEPVSPKAARTIERTITPPVAWDDLLRPGARQKGNAAPCRS